MSALAVEERIGHLLMARGSWAVEARVRELMAEAQEEIVRLREEQKAMAQRIGDGLLRTLFYASAESATHFAIDSTGKGGWYAGPPTLNYAQGCHEGRTVRGALVVMGREEAAANGLWKSLVWARPPLPESWQDQCKLAAALLCELRPVQHDFGGHYDAE